MVEWLMKKRLLFKEGKQRAFIENIQCHLSVDEIAHICRCSPRTIRDWRREKFLMDRDAALFLSKKADIPFPQSDIRETRNAYWYTTKGAAKGGYAVLKKYGHIGGDPERRKRAWRAWWEREGRFEPHPLLNNPLPFRRPRKSKDLAEFIGIVLGDGTIAKYQIAITLHSIDDMAYGVYIQKLVRKLFDVSMGIYTDKYDHASTYAISRIQLVNYCVEKLGIKRGNKVRQQVDIPDWIKKNLAFSIACMRGLFDTDGSVITHRYTVGGKNYRYKKLEFCSRSEPLRQSVYRLIKTLGLNARLSNRHSVWIDNRQDVNRYFEIIGSHNSKHLMRLIK